ncbi:MAG: hypothetical protein HC848_02780 [Limnobacter sp.]|nr:hypothetical protein [Limnobacter sp.]
MFDEARKKALPAYPFSLGLVTSGQAAAYADVKRALARRIPHVACTLYPASVQGKAAVTELLVAIKKQMLGGTMC